MRSTLAVLALLLAGCGAEAPQPSAPAPAKSEPGQAAPAPIQVRADWLEQRTLPAPNVTGFEARYVYAPPRRAISLSKLEEAQPPPAAVVIPPPPFKYVGKVARGRDESYAVLAGVSKVFVVRAGDTLEGGYGVQSVSDSRVVLVNLASGAAHALAYTSEMQLKANVPAVVSAPAPSSDDVASTGEEGSGGGD